MAGPAFLMLTVALGIIGRPAVATAPEPPSELTRRAVVAQCSAPAPVVGARFDGTVLQVMDGQNLCVALGPTPDAWIRVKIAGAAPDTRRRTLMAASFGQAVTCLAVKTQPSGVEARCSVNGAGLDRLIATDAARRAGLEWR